MQRVNTQLVHSASDIVGALECRHLAHLERAAVDGHLRRPMRADPVLDRIAQRGIEHEQRFLAELNRDGLTVVAVPRDETLPREEQLMRGREATIEGMRGGADVIYQAMLFEGRRLGYADFLRRVEQPSELGPWSYEVWDTKLARHAKASAVLQLSMYSEILKALQGRAPEEMHLALGGVMREKISFRVADYAAYYRSVAGDFEALIDDAGPSFPVPTKPEPVEHCEVCRWSAECRAQWRAEDDVSPRRNRAESEPRPPPNGRC
ncbi:MAG: nuclease, partial [Gammaproteobacteria bacterium]|nr:nuclease [Gammaproteobacteria bacterium]